MRKVLLKNNQEVTIRRATKDDAQNMIDFYNVVGGETDFLSFGKDEFQKDVNDYKAFIESTSNEKNSLMLLALSGDEIISIATIHSSQKERTKHVGTLGIVVSKKYIGMGLGKILMKDLIEWAKNNGVTKKISLVTREDNTGAIALYKKLGFQEEGLLLQDNFINGKYFNTVMMGLLI